MLPPKVPSRHPHTVVIADGGFTFLAAITKYLIEALKDAQGTVPDDGQGMVERLWADCSHSTHSQELKLLAFFKSVYNLSVKWCQHIRLALTPVS